MKTACLYSLALTLLTVSASLNLTAATPPGVGEKAPDFTLKTLDDQSVRLSDLTAKSKVVLILLRGWPGYQCPICDRQVHDFIASASAFDGAKARVIMVYPEPAEDLKAHAKEFAEWKGKEWPKDFLYVMDPDYTMVNAYNLRWDARRETAYPSTFVLDRKGVVRFAKISHTHGDRTQASAILEEVKRLADD
jgi:thioredoxin-dependent peroxiredoxin